MSDLSLKLKIHTDAKGSRVEIEKLTDSIDKSGHSVAKFSQQAKKAERNVDSFGHSGLSAGNNIKKGLMPIKSLILGITSALVGISLSRITEETIRQNRELNNLTNTYKLNRQEVQLWQIAVSKMGLSVEKVGDILKDTQDKVGDFLATGGGEAKDIFERLKLNAEELRNLQPDEILKKIVNRMDEIKGISEQERVFLMESIADEASRLLPLLSDNAKKLEEIRETATASGAILTDEQNQVLQNASQLLADIDLAASGVRSQVAGIGALFVTEFGDEALAVLQMLSQTLKGIDAESLRQAGETAKFAAGTIATLYIARNAATWLAAISAAAALMQTRVIAATGGMAGMRLMIDALTTRAVAGSIAMRGFSAALMLIGGPAGAAILAGAALAYMAMEADKERQMIERADGSHIALADAIQIATNASYQFNGASAAKRAELKTEIQALIQDTQAHLQNAKAVLKAAQARASAARAATKISSYKYGGKTSETEAGGYEGRALDAELNVIDIEDTVSELQDKLNNLGKDIKVDPVKIPKINIPSVNSVRGRSGSKGSIGRSPHASGRSGGYSNKVAHSSKSSKSAKKDISDQQKAVNTLTSQYEQLEGRLDSAAARQRSYNKDVETLNAAVKAGVIPKEREAELLERLKYQYENAGQSLDSLRSAEQNHLDQLKSKHAELTLGERAYREYTLKSQGFSAAVIKEALAIGDSNKAIEEHTKAQKKAAEELDKLTSDIESKLNTIFEDALFNGKNLFDSLIQGAKDLAKQLIMKMVINPVANSVSGSIAQTLLPQSGGSTLNAVGGGINPSSLSSLANITGKGGLIQRGQALLIGNQIGEGISSVANQLGGKIGNAFSGAAEMTNFQLGGAALIGGVVGGVGQKGTQGSLGGSLGGLGAAALGLGPVGIGLAILGGGAIGGLFGGGKQVGSGVIAGYKNGDVFGDNYTTTDKGWIRGESDSLSELDKTFKDAVSSSLDSAESAIIEAAGYFGKEGAEGIINAFESAAVKMDFRDLDDAAVAEFIQSITDGMVGDVFGADLNIYRRSNEGLSDTLSRLYSSTTAVDAAFDLLGSNLDVVGYNGAEAASRLVDMFGGLEQFNAAMDTLQKNLSTQLAAIAQSFTDQIALYNRLQRSAEKLRSDIEDIRFNVNSALGREDQFKASQSLYNSTLSKAKAGEEDAVASIGSIAKQYHGYQIDNAKTRFEARLGQAEIANSLSGVADNVEALENPQEEMIRQQEALIAQAESQLEQMYLDNLLAVDRGEKLNIINTTLNTLPERIGSTVGSAVNGAISNIKIQIPGFASGGDFGGGLAIVGENGPELRQFGASRFTSFNKTKELFSSSGAAGDDSIQRKLLAAVERLTDENRQMKKYLKGLARNSGTTAILNKFSTRKQLKPLGVSS